MHASGTVSYTHLNRVEVERTLAPIVDGGAKVDTVVLGCTHFPLLAGPIRHALGPGVRVVSSAEETTRELEDILRRRDQLAPEPVRPEHRFATTSDNIAEFAAAGSFIFGQDVYKRQGDVPSEDSYRLPLRGAV